LKTWNAKVFGNVERNNRKLFEELQAFNTIEGSRALVDGELLKKSEIVSELERCSLLDEVSWRQKSRVTWLKGDKCTKFFHSIANSNRRYNSMDSLLIGDSISSDPAEIGKHMVQFYQDLFSEKHSWRPWLYDLSFDAILESEASWLERAFE
jgi:hypothetical protein